MSKGAFIVYCNAAALLMYIVSITYLPQLKAMHCTSSLLLCSSLHRDGNTATATYCNADAVDYECSLTLWRHHLAMLDGEA